MSQNILGRSVLQSTMDPIGMEASGRGVLAFASQHALGGKKVVLATLVKINGKSPRELGTQMAMVENGQYSGAISSGCLERAIIAEALTVIATGSNKTVQYGRGSKYMDIVLPCGSGVTIRLNQFTEALAKQCSEKLQSREPFCLSIHEQKLELTKATDTSEWYNNTFVRRYNPPLQIVVAGIGAELVHFSHMAHAAGYDVVALSPEQDSLEACAGSAIKLRSSSSQVAVTLDQYTAFVSLLHEREWDLALLRQMLASSAFYVGAVGSRKTEAARREMLQYYGVSKALLSKLNDGIGLIPSTRNIPALSISILAEVVDQWQKTILNLRPSVCHLTAI